MSIEDLMGDSPTEAEMTAWRTTEAAFQGKTFARCRQKDTCTEPYGYRWQLLVQDNERAGKCVGCCPCEETTQRAITLECDFSLTLVRQQDSTWQPGAPARITVAPGESQ